MTAIEPFTIDIPQEDLDYLLDRVARARWANELPFDQVHRGEGGPGRLVERSHGEVRPGHEGQGNGLPTPRSTTSRTSGLAEDDVGIL